MKTFVKDNLVVWIWLALAVFIELFSITFTDSAPFLTNPLYPLILLAICFTVLIIISNKLAKSIVACVLTAAQIAICVGFVFLYEQNGTTFDFSMINQRNDAFGTLEKVDLNIVHLSVLAVIFVVFLAFAITYMVLMVKRKQVRGQKFKLPYKLSTSIICGLLAFAMIFTPLFDGVAAASRGYETKLYSQKYSRYQTIGITTNAIYELFSGVFGNKISKRHLGEMQEYLFGDESNRDEKLLATSDFNGISSNKNLIVIMVESFDWYPLTWYDAETIATIYPNIVKFMGGSVVLDNFHAREKTDTSENNAQLGSNPTGKYLNYDFPNNAYPYSLPNLFKTEYEEAQVKAFHQNQGDFYNRNKSFKSLGYEEFVDISVMKDYGVENTWDEHNWSKGERTKDSETMLHMKEQMFPLDKQFMTYWLTFSMHGFYGERENLRNFIYESCENGYYGYFDSLGIFPTSETDENQNYVRNYAAAVKDFDVALGYMFDYLETNNLLDNSTIVMFGDHNTYYNNLAYYGKHIQETYNSELYRIPCFIYDADLIAQYESTYGEGCYKQVIGNDENPAYKFLTLSKFTTTIDLIPTILDLFGIKGWANLYLGTSVFIEDVESIIYSRAYGIFVTDKLVCYSVNNLLYTIEGFTEEDKLDFIERAEKHLKKQEYLDEIFYYNYFANHEYIVP